MLAGPVSLLSPPGRTLRAIEGRSLVPHQLPLPGGAYPSYLQSKPWGMGVGVIQRLRETVLVNLCDSGQVSSRGRSDTHYVGHWLCTRVTERLPGKHSINLYCGAQNQEQQPCEYSCWLSRSPAGMTLRKSFHFRELHSLICHMRVIDSTLGVVVMAHHTDTHKAVDMGSGSGSSAQ